MPTHGKKYVEAKKAIDSQKQYSVEEAVKLVKQTNYAKFDATVNIAIKTNANPKYNDQMLRATTILPHGTGKTKKVAVFVVMIKLKKLKKLVQISLDLRLFLMISKLVKWISMFWLLHLNTLEI